MSQKQQSPEEENTNFFYKLIGSILFGIPLLIYFLKFLRSLRKKNKATYAEEYHVNDETFLKWITQFCPKNIKERYVGSAKQQIMIGEIYPYLGKPLSTPTSKADLARELFVSRNTLNRHFQKIPNFEQEIGISIESYKKEWRVFPPRIYTSLLKLHEKHYATAQKEVELTA